MGSRKTSTSSPGFTLIEMLVVMGLLVILASLGLLVSMETYRGSSFRNERDTVVSILQKARSQAVSNVCLGSPCPDGAPHGVHVQNDKYVIFQGTTYSSGSSLNEIIKPRISTTQITETTDIVFAQLSGSVTTPGTITVSDNTGHSSVITINSEGQIIWTN